MYSDSKLDKKSTKRSTAKKKSNNFKHSKFSSSFELQRQQICDTAARIIYEDGIRDYQKAKQRACDLLHLKSNTSLPTNEEIEHAVHQRINLFEAADQITEPQNQFGVAKDILGILSDYQPRVTQTLTTSVKLKNIPLEIHTFSDTAELICDELNWRGISNFLVEKRYRYSNAQYANVPLIICQLDNYDIEISVFKEKELHRSPVCPTNGKTYQRISLKQLNQMNADE